MRKVEERSKDKIDGFMMEEGKTIWGGQEKGWSLNYTEYNIWRDKKFMLDAGTGISSLNEFMLVQRTSHSMFVIF